MSHTPPVDSEGAGSDVLVTVYAHHIQGRDIQIRFSEEIFLDEQPEMIGKAVIDMWKVMKYQGGDFMPIGDKPAPRKANK